MESEFAHTLDKLSSAESETASFWQGKCEGLERELALAQRQLQAQGRGSQGHGQIQVDGDGEDGIHRERELDAEVRELRCAWEAAREAVARRDEEILGLRAQVRGLKEWVSVSTRSDGQAQTSDEVFGEGMARLGNGLQNWVLVNFRRAKIGESFLLLSWIAGPKLTLAASDLSSADDAAVSELGRLVPMYEDLASASKIHLLQSVVSRVLVDLVFDTYFAGLSGDMAAQLQQAEAFLASCGKMAHLASR
jgi:hypothetical protein